MSQRFLILRMTNKAVYFNRKERIEWSATNFPKEAATFIEHRPIYWLVNMLEYVYQSGKLRVEVLEYELEGEELEGFNKQALKKPVRKLEFALLDKDQLRAQLSYFASAGLTTILEPPLLEEARQELELVLPQAPEISQPLVESPDEETLIERTIQFSIPFESLEFGLAEVRGTTTIAPFPEPVPFQVYNDYIIPEFEHIKGYFIKLLKRKTVEISARLLIEGDAVELRRLRSPQIAAINQDMLYLVRQRRLRELLNPKLKMPVDKSIFTPDDLFESLESEDLGRKLIEDGDDALLREVFAIRKVRNKKSLAWLATSLHDDREPIRYTLQPQFGFLFFAEGENCNHFIWELLNSHATYIWSFDRNADTPNSQYRRLEREIAKIGQHGRMLYQRSDLDAFLFSTVRHPSASSKLIDGFPRWRNKLLEQLI